MILARIFTKIFKEGGIILIDAKGQKYICGNPTTEKPITVKLLKDDLNWKLLLDPELEFPEAYMRNEIQIENASMKDFLMELIKNSNLFNLSINSFCFSSDNKTSGGKIFLNFSSLTDKKLCRAEIKLN